MAIRVTGFPTESQQYQRDRCNRFSADPMQYFLREYQEFIQDPINFFIIRYTHAKQAQMDDFARFIEVLARVFPSPGEILRGRICPPDRVTLITQIGLTSTSAAGVVGVVAGIITGLPPVTALSAALVLGSVAGIHAAGEAASLRERVENAAQLRDHLCVLESRSKDLGTEVGRLTSENAALQGTSQRLGGQVTQFSQQIDHLRGQNATLHETSEYLGMQVVRLEAQSLEFSATIDRLNAENSSLGEKVARLQEGILQFSVQNESYRIIAEKFSLYLTAFRADSVEAREGLAAKILEFTENLTASRELWDRVSCDTTIFRKEYELQISELKSLILKITDPRHTLIQLAEHQAIGDQIKQSTAALESYQRDLSRVVEDLARREGEVLARDSLLRELEVAHRQILIESGAQATAQGARNAELGGIIETIRSLVSKSLGR